MHPGFLVLTVDFKKAALKSHSKKVHFSRAKKFSQKSLNFFGKRPIWVM